MKSRSAIDPELHTLRSLIRATSNRDRNDLESARFGIFAAFESREPMTARRWSKALRAALSVATLTEEQQTLARESLAMIDRAIESEE